MIVPSDTCDVLIVGGGPAGATCAWRLQQSGVDARVLDRATFPRDKVCAGWITPQVVESLELNLDKYRIGRVLQPITSFRVDVLDGHVRRDRAVRVDYEQPVSYGIRRCEFDAFLLRRCGAPTQEGVTIHSIKRDGGDWVLNNRYRARVLVGAGGHFCPVARYVRLNHADRENDTELRIVIAQEVEYELFGSAARCQIEPGIPELFFYPDLRGYAWCFRKGNWLNIGLGREGERNLSRWRDKFVGWLVGQKRIPKPPRGSFKGHAYRLNSASVNAATDDGIILIGDAAGLANPHSGEGIRPAIESALIAAHTIAAANDRRCNELASRFNQRLSQRFGHASKCADSPLVPVCLRNWLARKLLRRRRFVRGVVLDDWFLNRSTPALKLSPPVSSETAGTGVRP